MAARFTSEAIRPATVADAAACAAVYSPSVTHGTASFEIEPPDADEMARRMGRCLAAGWPWLVADVAGEVIGYAYCTQFRDRAAYRQTAETSVYVADGRQGSGVGAGLMRALIGAAGRAGFRELVAVIGDSGNLASVGLHQAMGFRHVGTLTGVGRKQGRWLDVVYMQLSIDELH